jgi:hypothetical protein
VKHQIIQKRIRWLQSFRISKSAKKYCWISLIFLLFKNSHSEYNRLDCFKHVSGFIKFLSWFSISLSNVCQIFIRSWYDFYQISIRFLSDFYHCILRNVPSRLIDRNYCNFISRLSNNLVHIAVSYGDITILNWPLFMTWNNRDFDD